MHRQTFCIRLAGDVGQFLFGPVGETLMSVGIEWLHKACTAFHRAVHEELEPVGLDVGGGILLNVNGFLQVLIHIHPALNLVGQTHHEVHLAFLIHLLGSLEEIVVEEIVAPTVDIHGVTLCHQMLLDLGDDDFGGVNRIETFGVEERTCVSASLLFQETGRRAVLTHHDLTATDILIPLQYGAVFLHDTSLDQHQGVCQALVTFIVGKVDGDITADGIQLLTGGYIFHKGDVIPAKAEDGRRSCLASLLNGSGDSLCKELVGSQPNGYRSDDRQGNTHRIMCMTVTAARHHKTLAGIVHNLSLAFLNKSLSTFLVAYIDVLAVFHCECFYNLIVF